MLWELSPVAHILSGGVVVRTLACPLPERARDRLRGARAATAGPPRLPEALTIRRRVSVRGAIMIGGQRIQVGLPHAGKTAEIRVGSDTYQISVEDGITFTAPRKTSRDIKRHKASNYAPALRCLPMASDDNKISRVVSHIKRSQSVAHQVRPGKRASPVSDSG